MYFPYFYGRQSELLAVVDAAGGFGSPQLIVPIIEPVTAAKDLVGNLAKLSKSSTAVYLIVNPSLGNLKTATAQRTWFGAVQLSLASALVRPVLSEGPATTANDLATFAAQYAGRKIGVVLNSSRIAPKDVASALKTSDAMVFLRAGAALASYPMSLGPGRTANVSDNFRPEVRNADYDGEEWLGNNHLTYVAAGQGGFSDYTILPGGFSSGGGPIGAAALHLSYKVSNGDLWVQHFVSDETDRNLGTTSSKLLEAMAYLEAQVVNTPKRFASSPALATYRAQLAAGQPTSLGGSKRLQIAHHLFTVGKHLGL